MPIETSPIPFAALQLPYTPLFDPTAGGEIAPNGTAYGSCGGGGGGSRLGMSVGPGAGMMPMGMGWGAGMPHSQVSHGPASVAASAIIAPTPGAVAGPHRPIPALPDAGYTAPTFRAASLTGYPSHHLHPRGQDLQRGLGLGGEAGTVYAGGSLYGAPQSSPYLAPAGGHIQQHHHQASLHPSHNHDGRSGSLPAPRRASVVAPVQQSGRDHSQSSNPTHHQQAQVCGHHSSDAEDGGRSPSEPYSPQQHHYHHHDDDDDDDDGASDASYYARPRHMSIRRQRTSSQGSSASDMSNTEVQQKETKLNLHRRTLSNNFQLPAGRHRSTSMSSADHEHSPVSSSPLRANEGQGKRVRKSSLREGDGLGLAGLQIGDDQRRIRKTSFTAPHQNENAGSHLSPGDGGGRTGGGRPIMHRQKSNLRPIEASLSDSEQTIARRSSVRQRSTSRLRRRSKDDGDATERSGDSEKRSKGRQSPRKSSGATSGDDVSRVRRVASIRRSRKHSDHHEGGRRDDDGRAGEGSPYHRPRLPVDHSPMLSPHSTRDYVDPDHGSRSRRHSHDHRHHFAEEAYRQEDQPVQHRHRRTYSEASHHPPQAQHAQAQREYAPPPQAGTLYPGQSASVIGAGHDHTPQQYRQQLHSIPVGGQYPVDQAGQPMQFAQQHQYPQGHVFDDGASAVGTGLTFMDGAMDGRVSQYGLPKYAHNPKVDYRRFCVQRGTADVFID